MALNWRKKEIKNAYIVEDIDLVPKVYLEIKKTLN
jgi:hypothetical protein